MTLKPSKTALLVAAIATAVTLGVVAPSSAKAYWVSGDAAVAEVVPAQFKVVINKHPRSRFHHGHRTHRNFHHRGHRFHSPRHRHFKGHHPRRSVVIKKRF